MDRVAETEQTAPPPSPPARRGLSRGAPGPAPLGLLVFLVGAFGGSFQGRLAEVQKNDNAAYLPATAESTKVGDEQREFSDIETVPGFVVYHRDGGLTDADKAAIAADVNDVRDIDGVAADQVAGPQFSSDGATASVIVPLIGRTGEKTVNGDQLVAVEQEVLRTARDGAPAGLAVHSAGVGGLLVAFIDAFGGLDSTLLLVAGIVVIVILLVVYRSPVLWFFPLFSAVLALGAASLAIYFLAKNDVLTLNGQSQGILFVLVIGAGTDYALLLISRYREELHTTESRVAAMTRAWRGAAPAIGASAATVILGLLCLGFGELNSDRSLGPVCAIGIACTVIVMLTFLPAFLALFGRWVFWPRTPRVDSASDIATHGVWWRFATALGRRARPAWIGAVVVLHACLTALPTLSSSGLSLTDSFTNEPDAVVGQRLYDGSFPQGAGAPTVIATNADAVDDVLAAVSAVPGVATDPGSVCVAPDFAKLAQLAAGGGFPTGAAAPAGCLPEQVQVQPHHGRLLVDATLTDRFDTTAAQETV